MLSLATALLAALLGCARNEGDPGDRRLKALQADPAVRLAPPGGQQTHAFSQPASAAPLSKYFSGPRVSRRFRLGGPEEEARRYYFSELPRLGWHFERSELNAVAGYEQLMYRKDRGPWTSSLTVSIDARRHELDLTLTAPPARAAKR